MGLKNLVNDLKIDKVKKRIAIYCRVSTIEQAEEGYSIDEQERLLTEWCSKMDYIVTKYYSDRGISGKDIREEVSIDDLNREFNLGISNVKITEEKISMDYFTCETIFIRTLKECQKDIDTMVKIISNKLDKFKINNFELICNYYTWID